MAEQMTRPNWSDEDLSGVKEQNRRLWGMVDKYTGHPLLLDFLADLIRAYNVPGRDPIALVKAIQDYSATEIKFFRERPERFQSPMRTIIWGFGDCDDKAILVGAAVRTFRVPVRLAILRLALPRLGENGKADPRLPPVKVGHVYPEAWMDDAWIPLESVRPYPWGHDPSLIAAQRGFLKQRETIGDKPEIGAYA
jgi:hypothetical protein